AASKAKIPIVKVAKLLNNSFTKRKSGNHLGIARILLINPLSDKNEIETTLAMLPKRANGNKDSKVRCTALTMTRRRSQTNLLTHLFWIAKMSYIKPPTFISLCEV